MLAIFLLNPRGYHHFRLTMQRYENFMTLPNLEGSEFTLLKGKICIFYIAPYTLQITVIFFLKLLSFIAILYITIYIIYILYI